MLSGIQVSRIGQMKQDLCNLNQIDLSQIGLGRRIDQGLYRDHERLLHAQLVDAAEEGEVRQKRGQTSAQLDIILGERRVVHEQQLGEEFWRAHVAGHE